jgi:hypothetical protein
MQSVAPNTRPDRHEHRFSAVASRLPTNSLYLPWKDDRRNVTDVAEEVTRYQPPLPTVVEVSDGAYAPSLTRTGRVRNQSKTFAELQQVLIRNELVGDAATKARVKARS